MTWKLLRAFWVPLQGWLEWILLTTGLTWLVVLGMKSLPSEQWAGPMLSGAFLLGSVVALYRARRRRLRLEKVQEKTELTRLAGYAGAILPLVLLIGLTAVGGSRMQPKTRQSEAKIALAQIYGRQGEHYKKHRRNSWSLDELGYEPEGHRRFYAVGFPPHCAPGVTRLAHSQNNPHEIGRESEAADWFESLRGQPCDDPVNGFTAYAVGIIRNGGRLDIWKIDAEKRLVNVQDGTRKRFLGIWW